jgi:hypothetical protein
MPPVPEACLDQFGLKVLGREVGELKVGTREPEGHHLIPKSADWVELKVLPAN